MFGILYDGGGQTWGGCVVGLFGYYMMGVARLGEGVFGLFGYYMMGVARLGEGVFGPADRTSKVICYVVNNLLSFVVLLLCIVLVIHLVCSI